MESGGINKDTSDIKLQRLQSMTRIIKPNFNFFTLSQLSSDQCAFLTNYLQIRTPVKQLSEVSLKNNRWIQICHFEGKNPEIGAEGGDGREDGGTKK